jgi:hypothetical protein
MNCPSQPSEFEVEQRASREDWTDITYSERMKLGRSISVGPFEYMPFLPGILWSKARAGKLERLDTAECIDNYATSIQSNRRNLLLVAQDDYFPPPEENFFLNKSRIYWAGDFRAEDARDLENAPDPYSWMCTSLEVYDQCSDELETIKKAGVDLWRVGYYCDENSVCDVARWPVEYCLSEPAEPHCKLHFELPIAIVIIVLNFGESLSSFLLHLFQHRGFRRTSQQDQLLNVFLSTSPTEYHNHPMTSSHLHTMFMTRLLVVLARLPLWHRNI